MSGFENEEYSTKLHCKSAGACDFIMSHACRERRGEPLVKFHNKNVVPTSSERASAKGIVKDHV